MEGWDGTTDGRPTDLVRRRWGRFGAERLRPGVGRGHRGAARRPGQPATSSCIDEATVDEHRRAARRCSTPGQVAGPPAHPLGPLVAGPTARPRPAPPTRTPSSTAASAPARRRVLHRRRARRAGRRSYVAAAVLAAAGRLRLRRREALPRLPAPRAAQRRTTGPAPTAATSPAAPASSARSSAGIRDRAPGPRRSPCGCRRSTSSRSPPGDDGVGVPDGDGPVPLRASAATAPASASTSPSPRASSTCSSELGIGLVSTTAGSPYYNPHVQRPAYFPPSDGYQPPEDPLVGVARQLAATAELTAAHPGLAIVGVGLLVPPGLAAARRPGGRRRRRRRRWSASAGWCSSYPDLPADVLAGRAARAAAWSAAPSATAPPPPATAWCRAASRSTPSTRTTPSGWSWPRPSEPPSPPEGDTQADPAGPSPSELGGGGGRRRSDANMCS